MSKRYEYIIIDTERYQDSTALNERLDVLGGDGWRVTHTYQDLGTRFERIIMEREIERLTPSQQLVASTVCIDGKIGDTEQPYDQGGWLEISKEE